MTTHDTTTDLRERVRRVLGVIQEAVDREDSEALTLDALAREAHLSRFHFSRLFSAMVGESVRTHVRRMRLERAAADLLESTRSVIEVALSSGYEAHAPFTRAFSAHFGVPPTEFRALAPEHLPYAPSGVRFGAPESVRHFIPLTEERPMIEVDVKEQPARRVIAIEHRGPYQELGGAFQRLVGFAGPAGLFGPTTEMLGVYHDDPDETAPEELRSEACMTVPPNWEGEAPEGMSVRELEGGTFGVGTYTGSYANLAEVYRWLYGTWLPESGRCPAERACFEIYRTNPMETPPEKNVTEIYIPLSS